MQVTIRALIDGATKISDQHYPRWWRKQRGQEMIGVLLDSAGQTRGICSTWQDMAWSYGWDPSAERCPDE
jgi:hypothetical protein